MHPYCSSSSGARSPFVGDQKSPPPPPLLAVAIWRAAIVASVGGNGPAGGCDAVSGAPDAAAGAATARVASAPAAIAPSAAVGWEAGGGAAAPLAPPSRRCSCCCWCFRCRSSGRRNSSPSSSSESQSGVPTPCSSPRSSANSSAIEAGERGIAVGCAPSSVRGGALGSLGICLCMDHVAKGRDGLNGITRCVRSAGTRPSLLIARATDGARGGVAGDARLVTLARALAAGVGGRRAVMPHRHHQQRAKKRSASFD